MWQMLTLHAQVARGEKSGAAQNHFSKISFGVASVSRIDKIVGLFCKRALSNRQYSAEETYNSIDPTN